MKKIVIATQNKGKAKDFETMLAPLGYKVLTLLDVAQDMDVEETGVTFEENAILKAEAVSKALGIPVISDDSGLEIDALNGEPGVYSARYAGAAKSDSANIDKVLEKLNSVPDSERTARFRCVLAISAPGQQTETFSGSCEGAILHERRGDNGFGYDPIFYVPAQEKAMAELEPHEKASISHRGNALRKLSESMPAWLNEEK
ncbi:non-canonical purine NTP pyrophosphatase [Planococcus antarcticus DSM 14505]|uniref:dITP/XTP pyrophosphatase n=1 Tax=Planococcus antarcticus DSM 14505 TaxID=1185653 RepID=A0ABN4RHA0_9BACL|nr:XTP/dITP diphosphatase [Planococcus antarcticus]ANU11339.1 non-canonical purine NTP pyrophosphatase [Planococcus antarcticus DSM 14505]